MGISRSPGEPGAQLDFELSPPASWSEPFPSPVSTPRLRDCPGGVRTSFQGHRKDGRGKGVERVVKLRASAWDLLKPVSHCK